MRTMAHPRSVPVRASEYSSGRRGAADAATSDGLRTPVMVFLVGLIIPWIIPLGILNLSVYRIVLLITIVPCFIAWLSGKAGPKRAVDFLVIAFWVWSAISLIATEGLVTSVEPSGIFAVETLGAYFLARVYIRTMDDFRRLILVAAAGVLLLLPFALIELVTGAKPLLSIFGLVFPTVRSTEMFRSGLWRVQGPFDHSIIFGVNCVSIFALAFLAVGHSAYTKLRKAVITGGIALAAIFSLSSAPLAVLALQSALLSWKWVFKRMPYRWILLFSILFCCYLVVEFGSNQTPIQFYIRYFTFDMQTGWHRLWIWDYGSASVAAHPWFGIGFADWVRPWWLHSDSVDNFWLLMAMRHGIPAFAILAIAILTLSIAIGLRKSENEELNDYRVGYLIVIAGYVFAGSTVHFWAGALAWFFFLLGSGPWMLEPGAESKSAAQDDSPALATGRRRHQRSTVRRERARASVARRETA
ncbi:MAG: O-antigen ligase family protein [Rhizobiaceae bacterium]|nr:O-antigen ligase family protein [Rhizobiaceae bacterium]